MKDLLRLADEVQALATKRDVVMRMDRASRIASELRTIAAQHADARGGGVSEDGWPDYVMLRDTKLHDDMGGLGQRIFTTAGAGYKKVKYVRADLVATPEPPTAAEHPPRLTQSMLDAQIENIELLATIDKRIDERRKKYGLTTTDAGREDAPHGWLHEIEWIDGWGSPQYVHGPTKPKPHIEQVAQDMRDIVAPTIKGDRFRPLYTVTPAGGEDGRDAERYRALVATGKFVPAVYASNGWALGCGAYTRPTKAELDAAADELIAAQAESGGRSDG
jgi:hypothetical protein